MICGIDLAGTESRPTGICLLHAYQAFHTLFTDTEILAFIRSHPPSLVAIDAPLSFHGDPFRECDRELRKEYRILPLTFEGMLALTRRGIALESRIFSPVIEVYPHATKKILGITRKEDLIPYGFSALPSTIHELDAAAAALTGWFYLQGSYKAYGTREIIIVPVQ